MIWARTGILKVRSITNAISVSIMFRPWQCITKPWSTIPQAVMQIFRAAMWAWLVVPLMTIWHAIFWILAWDTMVLKTSLRVADLESSPQVQWVGLFLRRNFSSRCVLLWTIWSSESLMVRWEMTSLGTTPASFICLTPIISVLEVIALERQRIQRYSVPQKERLAIPMWLGRPLSSRITV